MKRDFFDLLMKIMDKNKNIWFLSAGLGWPRTNEIKEKFAKRYIQCEAAEATMLDCAVGLAYSEKIPICYTITPFLLRGWETIRTYLNHEKLHCVLIGAGRNNEYSQHDGFSHEAGDIKEHFDLMKNFNQYYPNTKDELKNAILECINNKQPNFINVKK